jgi:hypothetical protein
MAAFEDIATLQFQARLASGQAVRNTFHFRRNPSAGDVDATWLTAWLADANTTTLINAYRGILRTADRFEGLLGRATRDPQNPGDERDEAYRAEDTAGTRGDAGTLAPDELTCILKVSGDLAGRRYRGRCWLPPPNQQGSINGENITSPATYRTNVLAFMAELVKTTYPSGGSHYAGQWNDVDMVVFSRAGRLADSTYYARVSSLAAPPKLHWLRSRNPTLA